MNERIKELSEQAQLYARQGMVQSAIKGLDADTMSEKYAKDFEEKFAELIVRECCGVLIENVEVALDASGSPVYPEGLIYEHFGVEE